jgi:hypothetical protein
VCTPYIYGFGHRIYMALANPTGVLWPFTTRLCWLLCVALLAVKNYWSTSDFFAQSCSCKYKSLKSVMNYFRLEFYICTQQLHGDATLTHTLKHTNTRTYTLFKSAAEDASASSHRPSLPSWHHFAWHGYGEETGRGAPFFFSSRYQVSSVCSGSHNNTWCAFLCAGLLLA